jgi:hypothetical protein
MTIRVVWADVAGFCPEFIGIPFAPRAAVEARQTAAAHAATNTG